VIPGTEVYCGDTTQMLADVRAMRTLLTPKAAWTKGAYARNGDGLACAAGNSRAAACWCLLGAVHRVCVWEETLHRHPRGVELTSFLEMRVPGGSLNEFNDTHTHEEVLTFLDSVIAELEAG